MKEDNEYINYIWIIDQDGKIIFKPSKIDFSYNENERF